MNKWDDLRWSEMRAAKGRLELDFDRLSQLAGRTFSLDAQEFIRSAAEQFIDEAFSKNNLPAKNESRLCQRIINKIDKILNGTSPQSQKITLRLLLEQADREGLVLPPGEVQRALKRLDDPDYLKELRAAALRQISPPQVVTNAEIHKIEINDETHKVIIETENPQMVDAGFSYGRSGAKDYLPFSLFARALYRFYCETGGRARYTHIPLEDSFGGEAIDFISEAIRQTCVVLGKEIAVRVCPENQINQGRHIARAIHYILKEAKS